MENDVRRGSFKRETLHESGIFAMSDFSILTEQWPAVLSKVKQDHDLTNISFEAWLQPLRLLSVENGTAVFLVPTGSMGINILNKKYTFPLRVAIGEVTGLSLDIRYVTPEDETADEEKRGRLELSMNAAHIDPRYSFESFVVGPNNQFANAAALAVAESPGEVYNPLYLYSGVGLGKTHLMHSICRFILENQPEKKVLYVTSETFTNELIDAIRKNRANDRALHDFREKYRGIDVLAIDDIQFIVGKESTQEEFFHTFNALYAAKKQIIISSDKPPKDLDILEDRIMSRLEMGLIADISVPDYETRMAIIRKKEEEEGFVMDDRVREYIAQNVTTNIRNIEGCVTQIKAKSVLGKMHVNIEIAQDILQDTITPNKDRRITPEMILAAVCEHFHLTEEELKSKKRIADYVYPRKIAMYLCREMTGLTQQATAKIFNKKDHTTVISACASIDREIESDAQTKRDVEVLKKKLNSF